MQATAGGPPDTGGASGSGGGLPDGFQNRQQYQDSQEAMQFMGGQLGPLQSLKRLGQGGQAAFAGLSAGAKRVVGHLAELWEQRSARLAQEKAADDWMRASMAPPTPSTMGTFESRTVRHTEMLEATTQAPCFHWEVAAGERLRLRWIQAAAPPKLPVRERSVCAAGAAWSSQPA